MTILIREATFDDAAGIACVHIESWKEGYKGIIDQSYLDHGLDLERRTEKWKEILQNGKDGADPYKNFVAQENDQIAGFADIGPSREEGMQGYAELYAIYLDPNYFGKGVGQQLFEAIRSQALKWEYEKLFVWVLEKNKRGRDFYERAGGIIFSGSEKEIMIDDRLYAEVKYYWTDLND